ncbi:MAG TPA: hypothetical protein VF003_16880 [Pseudonocardiaceae bacterium]
MSNFTHVDVLLTWPPGSPGDLMVLPIASSGPSTMYLVARRLCRARGRAHLWE